MTFSFDAQQGLIVVYGKISGSKGERFLRLALDTGAEHSVINENRLIQTGYDPASAADRIPLITAGGIVTASVVKVDEVVALGKMAHHFAVLAHTLPPGAHLDGLLGLDFLRGHRLTLDFPAGRLLFNGDG